MEPTALAWLAGLWDGEGSVGATRENRYKTVVYIPQVQIQMTHEATLLRAAEVIGAVVGEVPKVHQWAERKAVHHRDAFGFSMRRTGFIADLAAALVPYAVTKREHWELISEFCRLRIDRLGVDEQGRLKRGGDHRLRVPYTDAEIAVAERLRDASRRGRAVAPTG